MYRIIAAVLAAGACASSLQAQTSPPAMAVPVFTLAEALDRAGASSPFQDAAAAGIRAAEAQRRVAGLRPNPSIVGEAENVADAIRRAGGEAIAADPESLPPRIADRYLELKAAGRL